MFPKGCLCLLCLAINLPYSFSQPRLNFTLNVGNNLSLAGTGYIFQDNTTIDGEFGASAGAGYHYRISRKGHVFTSVNYLSQNYHFHLSHADELRRGILDYNALYIPLSFAREFRPASPKPYALTVVAGTALLFGNLKRKDNQGYRSDLGISYYTEINQTNSWAHEIFAGFGGIQRLKLRGAFFYQITFHYGLHKPLYYTVELAETNGLGAIRSGTVRNLKIMCSLTYIPSFAKFKKKVSCWNEAKKDNKKTQKKFRQL